MTLAFSPPCWGVNHSTLRKKIHETYLSRRPPVEGGRWVRIVSQIQLAFSLLWLYFILVLISFLSFAFCMLLVFALALWVSLSRYCVVYRSFLRLAARFLGRCLLCALYIVLWLLFYLCSPFLAFGTWRCRPLEWSRPRFFYLSLIVRVTGRFLNTLLDCACHQVVAHLVSSTGPRTLRFSCLLFKLRDSSSELCRSSASFAKRNLSLLLGLSCVF
jgi:hypothetical protein